MSQGTLSAVIGVSFLVAQSTAALAADAAPTLSGSLAGNTLSAVMFVPHDAPNGGGELSRIVFQAYLRQDGSALIRRWDPPRDAYDPVAMSRWSVSGSTLCLDLAGSGGDGRLCVEAHVWGPRIAGNGTGTGRFALLDGDIEPGNTIVATR